jgi:hypothetical protein
VDDKDWPNASALHARDHLGVILGGQFTLRHKKLSALPRAAAELEPQDWERRAAAYVLWGVFRCCNEPVRLLGPTDPISNTSG